MTGVLLEYYNVYKPVSGKRFIPSILRTNRMPHMYVRMTSPSKAKLAVHGLLPPTIIMPSTYNQAIGSFRHITAVACLRGRLGLPLPSKSEFKRSNQIHRSPFSLPWITYRSCGEASSQCLSGRCQSVWCHGHFHGAVLVIKNCYVF